MQTALALVFALLALVPASPLGDDPALPSRASW